MRFSGSGRQEPERKKAYLRAIINSMKGSISTKTKEFHFVTAEFANESSSNRLKQRFYIVSNYMLNKRKQKIYLTIFSVLILIAYVFSYSFVIQPAYDPPQIEIIEEGAYEMTPENTYIVETGEGRFILKCSDGESVEINKNSKNQMTEDGFEIKEE